MILNFVFIFFAQVTASCTTRFNSFPVLPTVRDNSNASLTCPKKIKTKLRISERPLSVSYVGIRQLQETFGIAGKKALVVGSGHTATLALRYLYEYGASHVTVCSRTFSHAGNLLHEFPTLTIIPFEKRYEAMKECELVVSATASPHHIIREKDIQLLHPTAIF